MKRPGHISYIQLPISVRLALWYGLSLLFLMGLFATFIYASFNVSKMRDYDRHLAHEREQLMPYVRHGVDGPAFSNLEQLRSVSYRTTGVYGTYVRLFDAKGKVRYQSPNYQGQPVYAPEIPTRAVESTYSWSWDGQPVRTLMTPLRSPDGKLAGWLEVTGHVWSVHRERDLMARTLMLGIFLSLVLAVGGGYVLARRALHPVALLTQAARRIRATDLSARLPVNTRMHDELTELASTFNEMMERLEDSFKRERRFTSNAAHELLTPLATLKSELEVTLRRERSSEEYEETLRDVLSSVDEMTTMVRGLLELSRIDRASDIPRQPVNLAEVVHHQVERFEPRLEAKHLHLDTHAADEVIVRSDPVRMGQVVWNLLDNAIKYTGEGGAISIAVERQNGHAVVEVSDTGVGFDESVAARLLDRFFRADTPEVQAERGSGLGLAIVQAIVQADGGKVTAESEGPGKGSTFRVYLPVDSK